MKPTNQTIFIVDDDVNMCIALKSLFESIHYNVKTYYSAQLFLDDYSHAYQGSILVDVRMPGMSGLELIEHLNLQKNCMPFIVITGFGDMKMVVRAMKAGAYDFILKPFNNQDIIDVVQESIKKSTKAHLSLDICKRFELLSERERQVMGLISEGKLNKEIAYELDISMSTVEAHRASIMRKMQAKNMAQLIKFYIKAHINILETI